ncbi:MAG: hypothetical protein M3O22_00265 [Pseudomonadota bacterium]|nr:hypothetical protein [Pseudomonadota bacterium]
MAKGGKRQGSGRKPGSRNTLTREIADRLSRDGVTPLEIMLKIMRSADARGDEEMAMDAAKSAAPYMHPRLNQVDVGNKDDQPFRMAVSSDDVSLLKRFVETRGQDLLNEGRDE